LRHWMTGAPQVRLGTKCPSITSRCTCIEGFQGFRVEGFRVEG